MSARRLLLSCLLGLVAAAAQAAPCGPFTVTMYEHGALYYHAAGGWAGIDKDVVEELARRTGCKLPMRLESRVRIWTMLRDGLLDITVSGLATPERLQYAYFLPYLQTRNLVLLRNEIADTAPTMAQFLANPTLRIGTIKSFKHGAGYDAWLDKLRAQGRVHEAPDYISLLRLFQNGRVQAILQLNTNVPALQRDEALAALFRVQDWVPQENLQASLVVSRTRVPAPVRLALEQALHAMREDGTLRTIIERHVGADRATALQLR
jgi:polar amino acid transport system substrate-binding protein